MLTRESILALKPCRRTNWLIHMVVMGNKAWKYKIRERNSYQTYIKFQPEKPTWPDEVYTELTFEEIEEGRIIVQDVPNYMGDISAAWEIYEKVDYGCDHSNLRHGKMGAWSCTFDDTWYDQAHTAPESICKAALLTTISGEDEETNE